MSEAVFRAPIRVEPCQDPSRCTELAQARWLLRAPHVAPGSPELHACSYPHCGQLLWTKPLAGKELAASPGRGQRRRRDSSSAATSVRPWVELSSIKRVANALGTVASSLGVRAFQPER